MTIKPAKVTAPDMKRAEAKPSTCKDKVNIEYYVCKCGQSDYDRVYKFFAAFGIGKLFCFRFRPKNTVVPYVDIFRVIWYNTYGCLSI